MDELISQGGPLIWVQLVLLIFGIFYCFERFFYFHRARINVGDLLLGLAAHVRKKAFADAIHEVARAKGPVARVAHAVLMRHHLPRRDLRDIAQEAGQLEVPKIERNMRAILAVALLTPLIGLLGTVIGLSEVFLSIRENSGYAEASLLGEGIFKSLVTTAFGLSVAVPMYLCYLYFYGRLKRMVHRIERGGIETINIIVDARDDDSIVDFQETARAERVEKESAKK